MGAASRPEKTDELMASASAALARTEYFSAEALAFEALTLARQAGDFARMARILMPLREARRQRLQQALDLGTVTIVTEPVTDTTEVEPGCYLVRPPQAGADARRLRLLALYQQIPVAVVCREPTTMLGLCPIVAISPGVTVRTKIDPPSDPDQPDVPWLADALEALGDFAIESLDQALATLRRLDALLARLDAIPEHEALHQALEETCQQALREEADPGSGTGRRGQRRSGSRSKSA